MCALLVHQIRSQDKLCAQCRSHLEWDCDNPVVGRDGFHIEPQITQCSLRMQWAQALSVWDLVLESCEKKTVMSMIFQIYQDDMTGLIYSKYWNMWLSRIRYVDHILEINNLAASWFLLMLFMLVLSCIWGTICFLPTGMFGCGWLTSMIWLHAPRTSCIRGSWDFMVNIFPNTKILKYYILYIIFTFFNINYFL